MDCSIASSRGWSSGPLLMAARAYPRVRNDETVVECRALSLGAAEADAVALGVRDLSEAEARTEPGRVAAVPGAAADHFLLARGWPGRVLLVGGVVVAVEVGDPFPNVADHVVRPESRSSFGEFADRRRGGKAVVCVVQRIERLAVLLAPLDAFAAAR